MQTFNLEINCGNGQSVQLTAGVESPGVILRIRQTSVGGVDNITWTGTAAQLEPCLQNALKSLDDSELERVLFLKNTKTEQALYDAEPTAPPILGEGDRYVPMRVQDIVVMHEMIERMIEYVLEPTPE